MCFSARLAWLHMASVTLEHDRFTQAKSPQEHCGPWCDWMTRREKRLNKRKWLPTTISVPTIQNEGFAAISPQRYHFWMLISKSVLDNRCMKLLEVVSTLKRVWPSSSMAQLQIDASDTPGEIRGKFQVFMYWLQLHAAWHLLHLDR